MMDQEKKAQQVNDGELDEVSGGAGPSIAYCECLYCRHWVRPVMRGNRLFCPDCGMQIGGAMGGRP